MNVYTRTYLIRFWPNIEIKQCARLCYSINLKGVPGDEAILYISMMVELRRFGLEL